MTRLGVSYFGNRFLSHAKEDINRIASVCDYVVHTLSETDLSYHKAAVAKLFNASRKRGLEVWADPWGLGGVFGGEAMSRFLLEHRDSWQVMSDGRTIPAACINRPEWRSYVMEWVLTARDLGAQVIFWDEPHIAFDFASEVEGIYSCICPVCKNVFKKKFDSSMPARLDDRSRQFRRESIRSFVNDMMMFAKSKGLKNALCVYAYKGNAEYDLIWKEVGQIESLDIFGCDPYWRWRGHHAPAPYVGEFARYVKESTAPFRKGSQIWLQAMRLGAGKEPEIREAALAAVNEGITHLAAWSFDGGELLDPVLSEDPTKVWQAVEDVYKEIRKRN